MKLTKTQLKQIIKEEIQKRIHENTTDVKVGSILNFKDGETWKVTKIIGSQSKAGPRGVLAAPYGDTKKNYVSVAIEFSMDEINKKVKSLSEAFGDSDFDGTGLIVVGKTPLDNDSISELMEDPDFDYYGVWNTREGYWFFKEDEENIDELELELQREFDRAGINARFESQS
jgi:hypothetical protein